MKQIALIIAAMTALCLSACTSQSGEGNESGKDAQTAQTEMKTKTLVAYFSASGVTEGVAKQMAEASGADLHQIKPEQPYSDADLDWRDEQSRSSLEMKDLKSRPAITDKLENMAAYDTVYIGFPIWWYTAPTIVNTFVEAYDLKGKTLIPFATSGGSTIDKACQDLKATYPDLNWQPGKLLNNPTKEDIDAFMGGK